MGTTLDGMLGHCSTLEICRFWWICSDKPHLHHMCIQSHPGTWPYPESWTPRIPDLHVCTLSIGDMEEKEHLSPPLPGRLACHFLSSRGTQRLHTATGGHAVDDDDMVSLPPSNYRQSPQITNKPWGIYRSVPLWKPPNNKENLPEQVKKYLRSALGIKCASLSEL
nr:uncharacterized protein LOC107399955 isoform X2 [Peromyscus maniculatus bairdii]